MPLLEVEGLTVAYGGILALRGISFSVEEGSAVTLIGPNGAGKSTTLNAISGLVRIQAGSVRFDGRPLGGLRPHQVLAAGIVQVPEGRSIFARLTVEENLLLGGAQRRDQAAVRREIGRLCDRFPVLGQRLHQPGGALSGGEQQLLAIARGLLAGPRLLLLDEPSMGLAPRMTQEIFRLIQELRNEGHTILLVEQNARQALALSEEGYLLDRGAIVAHDRADALLSDPRVTASYLGVRGE